MAPYDQDDYAEPDADNPVLRLGMDAMDTSWTDTLVPTLALADRLEEWTELLSPWLSEQPTDKNRENYLDLLVGLCSGADAMRAMARGDVTCCIDSMNTAVRLLTRVSPDQVAIPLR